MKIINITEQSSIYTSNAYLILGEWNALTDKNTLIDVGCDPRAMSRISKINTGLGKRSVEQVILTHNHGDHSGMLKQMCERFSPKVYAFAPMDGVDELLKDGNVIQAGDEVLEVIHVPHHNHDSLCLYCRGSRTLFAGDTPVIVHAPGGAYSRQFVKFMERLMGLDIGAIYFGHGTPLKHEVSKTLTLSLQNIRQSTLTTASS